MNMAQIIKQKRLEKKLTQEELGNLLGLKKSAINKYESGGVENIKRSTIEKMADIFEIKPSVLMGWESSDENKTSKPAPPQNSKLQYSNSIQVYGKVCAGDGFEALENPIDEIINPYPQIEAELFALQIKGDSMDKVVSDGMYAIIQKQHTVRSGEIAVIMIDNDVAMIKRFYRLNQSTVVLEPESTNIEHKPLLFHREEINKLRILGKYIGCVSPLETYEGIVT